MAIKDYFKKDLGIKGLTIVEKITIAYIIFTSVLLCWYGPSMDGFDSLVTTRIGVIVIIGVLYLLRKFFPCRFTQLFSTVVVMLGLIFWYQEVYFFSSQLPYKDHIFSSIDWHLFGCQPSVEFCQRVTSTFWSEAFNLGYYSYYYLMLVTIFFYGLCRYKESEKAEFVFLTSFFLFYVIYEFLPVAGPYYYFHAIGLEAANSGNYPDLGHYFQTNHEMLHQQVKGVFSALVHDTQEFGELPAAAFPSSHCGMTVITMILAWKSRNRWLFWLMMPLAVLLCCATVYIRAHYLIDTIGGLVFAVVFYCLTSWMYERFIKKSDL